MCCNCSVLHQNHLYFPKGKKKCFFLTLYMLTFFHFKISLYNFNKSNNSGFVKKKEAANYLNIMTQQDQNKLNKEDTHEKFDYISTGSVVSHCQQRSSLRCRFVDKVLNPSFPLALSKGLLINKVFIRECHNQV